jgi:hypothetical protein
VEEEFAKFLHPRRNEKVSLLFFLEPNLRTIVTALYSATSSISVKPRNNLGTFD